MYKLEKLWRSLNWRLKIFLLRWENRHNTVSIKTPTPMEKMKLRYIILFGKKIANNTNISKHALI